ncbi:MAG: hypothetical protein A3F90_16115 [Deltaproteobacteria bacterium RIFCSPLOWO2_12_FULL_60_19]|nr:MAG: hypothetical protein A3F90_16115 [Deltaproteobacteria bacterium RIFCSPLOWO2_12_FULL_60_19]
MKLKPQTIFNLLVVVFFVVFIYEAKDWRLQARLYPWAIGIPMLVLSLIYIFLDLKGRPEKPAAQTSNTPMDFQFTKGIDPAVARRRALTMFGWIVGFFAGIWLLGFHITIPAFVFLYLKVQSGEKWAISIVLTAGAWLLFWGLFDWLLRLPFPDGQLLLWLGLK